MFANLKHVQPAQLIGFVRSIDWSAIPYNIKLTVVHELNIAITAFRVKHGLPEIDDGLPGEPTPHFAQSGQSCSPLKGTHKVSRASGGRPSSAALQRRRVSKRNCERTASWKAMKPRTHRLICPQRH